VKASQAKLIPPGVLIVLWTFLPIYHILVMALTPDSEAVSGAVFPSHPTLANFNTVLTEGHHFVDQFWLQLGNSAVVAVAATICVLVISLPASFAVVWLRSAASSLVSNMALLTYLLPAAFLAVPIYQTMNLYGLLDTRTGLVAAVTTFATPYALWLFVQAGAKLPVELKEAALIDGASTRQILLLIYVPLLAPAIVAIGSYAFLLSWNEYLYALIILSSEDRMTVPVGLNNFLNSDSSPWNLLMAAGLVYSLPPVAVYYFSRRFLSANAGEGAVKG
jgi:multiple sugar transport system permease protein